MLIKPITAVLAIVLEYYGAYKEGDFSWQSGYLYIAVVNNISVTISLYSLALFYMATEDRLK